MEYFKQSLKLTLVLVVVFSVVYPLLLWTIGRAITEKSEGSPVYKNGVVVGYENIGQRFSQDKYFWSRPSAVNYNASETGVTNYSYGNSDLFNLFKSRLDTFMVHNPEVKVNYIPDDIITSSGSGLDPHISYEGAFIQIARISKARNIDNATLNNILIQHIDKPFLGIFTKPKVNVLKLNMALDNLGNISNQNKN